MKPKIFMCPQCDSTDNELYLENAFAVEGGTFRNYRTCKKCGYSGQLFTEPDTGESYEVVKVKKKRKLSERFPPKRILLLEAIISILIILFLTAMAFL